MYVYRFIIYIHIFFMYLFFKFKSTKSEAKNLTGLVVPVLKKNLGHGREELV